MHMGGVDPVQWFYLFIRPPSLFHIFYVVYRSLGVGFVQQEVSLHLCSADVCVHGQNLLCEQLGLGDRSIRVEALEHLCELPVGAVSDVLFQIHATRSDQRRIQSAHADDDTTKTQHKEYATCDR